MAPKTAKVPKVRLSPEAAQLLQRVVVLALDIRDEPLTDAVHDLLEALHGQTLQKTPVTIGDGIEVQLTEIGELTLREASAILESAQSPSHKRRRLRQLVTCLA